MVSQILAFNTTTEMCSVALMVGHRIYNINTMALKRHSEELLPMINQLLLEVNISLKSLDYIIFDRGPGSFIGLRIGLSVAQGLSLGADLPLVEVSSLFVLAQGARRIFGAKKQIITTIDARIGKLYWAYHRTAINNWMCNDNMMFCVAMKEKIFVQKIINSLQGDWILVGTGWNNYSILTHITSNDPIFLRSIMFPEAQDMLPIGIYKWKKKMFITPDKIKPIYLCDKKYDYKNMYIC